MFGNNDKDCDLGWTDGLVLGKSTIKHWLSHSNPFTIYDIYIYIISHSISHSIYCIDYPIQYLQFHPYFSWFFCTKKNIHYSLFHPLSTIIIDPYFIHYPSILEWFFRTKKPIIPMDGMGPQPPTGRTPAAGKVIRSPVEAPAGADAKQVAAGGDGGAFTGRTIGKQ